MCMFFQIILEIRKEEDYRVPIWIIIGSTLGGLLLLSLLILALWKVMCPDFFKHGWMDACMRGWTGWKE